MLKDKKKYPAYGNVWNTKTDKNRGEKCHVLGVSCPVSGITCHMEPVTCHHSLMPTVTVTDYCPANSPIMQSRLVCKEPKPKNKSKFKKLLKWENSKRL